uniref:hypothetical protein n=1 Tax=Rothia nasimurium TaxID=85336 RepID=UPI002DD6B584
MYNIGTLLSFQATNRILNPSQWNWPVFRIGHSQVFVSPVWATRLVYRVSFLRVNSVFRVVSHSGCWLDYYFKTSLLRAGIHQFRPEPEFAM